MRLRDLRNWAETDVAGERVAIEQLGHGVELLSAQESQRNWSELASQFTVAIVHPGTSSTVAEWRTRRRVCTTRGGEIMAINAGDAHRTTKVHAPASFDAVKLDPNWLDDAMRALEIRGPFWFRNSSGKNERVFSAAQTLVRAVAERDESLVVESACQDLACAVAAELGESEPSRARLRGSPRRMERVREAIRHSSQRPSLEALARDAGISVPHMSELFRETYGVSVGQYWKVWQLSEARRLLSEGRSASEVANQTGFTDQPHFIHDFRRQYGLTPRRWLQIYQGRA